MCEITLKYFREDFQIAEMSPRITQRFDFCHEIATGGGKAELLDEFPYLRPRTEITIPIDQF
jgi:hypothetical protein